MNIEQTPFKQLPMSKMMETLRNFLMESTIYEALPQNSEVIILDKTFSCYDSFEIILENDSEDAVMWNSEVSNFDGLITYSDICEMLLSLFKNVLTKRNNIQIFSSEHKKIKNFNIGNDEAIEEETQEFDEESEIIQLKGRKSSSMEFIDKEIFNLLEKVKELNFSSFNEEKKQKLLLDLRTVTLKNWTNKVYSEVYQNSNIVSMDLDKNLYEVCEKLIQERLHRIIIMDKESQVVVGTITQRDILLFIVRNFKAENDEGFNIPINQLGWIPNQKIVCAREFDSVFFTFATMSDLKLSALPIVDQNGSFLGFIQKSDIMLIVKDDKYEMLSDCNKNFLEFLREFKQHYKALYFEGNKMFSPFDTLKTIVEKILFTQGNRLVYVEEQSNKIAGILTLTDLFSIYLNSV